jgi:hypothetical protein
MLLGGVDTARVDRPRQGFRQIGVELALNGSLDALAGLVDGRELVLAAQPPEGDALDLIPLATLGGGRLDDRDLEGTVRARLVVQKQVAPERPSLATAPRVADQLLRQPRGGYRRMDDPSPGLV